MSCGCVCCANSSPGRSCASCCSALCVFPHFLLLFRHNASVCVSGVEGKDSPNSHTHTHIRAQSIARVWILCRGQLKPTCMCPLILFQVRTLVKCHFDWISSPFTDFILSSSVSFFAGLFVKWYQLPRHYWQESTGVLGLCVCVLESTLIKLLVSFELLGRLCQTCITIWMKYKLFYSFQKEFIE